MKWANGLSILLWALSAVFFVYSHILSASKETGEVIAISVDGERILLDTLLAGGQVGLITGERVLSVEDSQSPQVNDTLPDIVSVSSSQPSPPPPSAPSSPSSSKPSCININSAAEAQLITIKGIGPVLAANIIRYREEKGKFSKKEDLLKVKGIGAAKMGQIAQQVCF